MHQAGATRAEIRSEVVKSDGAPVTRCAVDLVLRKKRKDPLWRQELEDDRQSSRTKRSSSWWTWSARSGARRWKTTGLKQAACRTLKDAERRS